MLPRLHSIVPMSSGAPALPATPSSPTRWTDGAEDDSQWERWESEGGAVSRAYGEPPAATTVTPPPSGLGRMLTTGVVSSLRRDGGFGFIAADTYARPWKLMFRRAGVLDDGFDRLREGQRVRFYQEARPGNPRRQQAICVEPWPVL